MGKPFFLREPTRSVSATKPLSRHGHDSTTPTGWRRAANGQVLTPLFLVPAVHLVCGRIDAVQRMAKASMARMTKYFEYALGEPDNWGADCDDNLYLTHKLWNELHAIERSARAETLKIHWTPEVAALQAAVEEREQVLKSRGAFAGADIDYRTRLASLNDTIRYLQERLGCPGTRRKMTAPQRRALEAIDERRKELMKRARQVSGLWWPNYNAVLVSFVRAMKHANGQGSILRAHRFNGGGRLHCQIQGGMSVDELFAGDNADLRLASLSTNAHTHMSRGERRRLSRSRLQMTVYTYVDAAGETQRRSVTFPIQLHRPLPQGAVIKEVAIVRSWVADRLNAAGEMVPRYRWRALFALDVPERVGAPHPHSNSACAVFFIWRKTFDGVRVACVLDTIGNRQFVVLPKLFLKREERLAELEMAVHRAQDEVRDRLNDMRRDPTVPVPLQDAIGKVLASPRARLGSMAQLTRLWQTAYADYQPDRFRKVESARLKLKRDLEERINLREKHNASRRDFLANAAQTLSARYGVIAIEHHTPAQPEAREFLDVIERVAMKMKASLQRYHTSSPPDHRCYGCGAAMPAYESLPSTSTCSTCGAVWDKDELNAHILITLLQTQSCPATKGRRTPAGASSARRRILLDQGGVGSLSRVGTQALDVIPTPKRSLDAKS